MGEANHDAHGLAPGFQWTEDYNAVLEKIASTDTVETEWPLLRNIIKYKLDQNISSFLADAEKLREAATPVPPFSPRPSTNGGLKIPPFIARERDESNPNEAPKKLLGTEETKKFRDTLFSQLDDLDGTPFTVQRLCELCARPREHYSAIGKYLRALERTVYVTSTWDSFPPLPPQAQAAAISSTSLGVSSTSVPATPLFSPIPFLHGDARRSKSRSPPPSPLALNGIDPGGGVPLDSAALDLEQKPLGMVDEMDDPGPGHLSDRPTALTSVTSVGEGSGAITLEERFVKASEAEKSEAEEASEGPDAKKAKTGENEDMVLDDQDGDKENKS
ncbi:PPP4R2-domain-containing protein [Dentipellis sp. KUC8613]|nr:PPP4R2-domain-containing protein [Dentipellis sp. KUC8613]